jgi:glycosyltransferase involved in cell wall biosynthesis
MNNVNTFGNTFLDKPEQIFRQRWAPEVLPLVSISCITYNHEKYIREALEGFLCQKTTFRIEILIHDDASTDSTQAIIKEYEKKYPGLIFPIYQTENQYMKGIKIGVHYQYPRARGKYIAKCEGDDYWTDPYKLQKQVDFLERNPNYSACFTNAYVLDEIHGKKEIYTERISEGNVKVDDIIKIGGHIYPSASLVYRKDCIDLHLLKKIPEIANDTLTIINLAVNGNVYFFDYVSCIYRRWKGGVYSSISHNSRKKSDWRKKRIVGYKKLRKILAHKYRKALTRRISLDSRYVIKFTEGVARLGYFNNMEMRDRIGFIKYGIKFLLGSRTYKSVTQNLKIILLKLGGL